MEYKIIMSNEMDGELLQSLTWTKTDTKMTKISEPVLDVVLHKCCRSYTLRVVVRVYPEKSAILCIFYVLLLILLSTLFYQTIKGERDTTVLHMGVVC